MSRAQQNDSSNPQSTQNDMAQASAAQLIRFLRSIYPNVITKILTDTENAALNEETTVQKQKVIAKQKTLIEYLNVVIKNLEDSASLPRQLNSSISATVSVIVEIAKSPRYSSGDKISVLKQMLSIAQTAPGFSTWDQDHQHGSSNTIYNSELKKDERVTASPAETLNLVCSAIMDQTRYELTQGSHPDKDTEHRIDSFFQSLLIMYEQEEDQYDLLFLLDQIFLDRPNNHPYAKPVVLFNDVNSFLKSSLSQFAEEQIKRLPEKKQNGVLLDWIAHQCQERTFEVPPIIAALRELHPPQSRNKPNEQWKKEGKLFLEKQLTAFGINPEKYKEEIMDSLHNIGDIQPPGVEARMMESILKKSKSILENLARATLSSMAVDQINTNRGLALTRLACNIEDGNVTKEELHNFSKAEEIFQKFFSHHDTSLMIGAENAAFKTARDNIQAALTTYFQTSSFPQDFDRIVLQYEEQAKQLRERFHANLHANLHASVEFSEFLMTLLEQPDLLKIALEAKQSDGTAALFWVAEDQPEQYVSLLETLYGKPKLLEIALEAKHRDSTAALFWVAEDQPEQYVSLLKTLCDNPNILKNHSHLPEIVLGAKKGDGTAALFRVAFKQPEQYVSLLKTLCDNPDILKNHSHLLKIALGAKQGDGTAALFVVAYNQPEKYFELLKTLCDNPGVLENNPDLIKIALKAKDAKHSGHSDGTAALYLVAAQHPEKYFSLLEKLYGNLKLLKIALEAKYLDDTAALYWVAKNLPAQYFSLLETLYGNLKLLKIALEAKHGDGTAALFAVADNEPEKYFELLKTLCNDPNLLKDHPNLIEIALGATHSDGTAALFAVAYNEPEKYFELLKTLCDKPTLLKIALAAKHRDSTAALLAIAYNQPKKYFELLKTLCDHPGVLEKNPDLIKIALEAKHSDGTAALYWVGAKYPEKYFELLETLCDKPTLLEIALKAKHSDGTAALYWVGAKYPEKYVELIKKLCDQPDLRNIALKAKNSEGITVLDFFVKYNSEKHLRVLNILHGGPDTPHTTTNSPGVSSLAAPSSNTPYVNDTTALDATELSKHGNQLRELMSQHSRLQPNVQRAALSQQYTMFSLLQNGAAPPAQSSGAPFPPEEEQEEEEYEFEY